MINTGQDNKAGTAIWAIVLVVWAMDFISAEVRKRYTWPMSKPTRITLVRHGEVHNPGGVYCGRLPRFGLSDYGRALAVAAGQHLRYTRPIALYGDLVAFAILWACGEPVSADGRARLAACGVTEGYPSPASLTTFTFTPGTDHPTARYLSMSVSKL